jgi:predicted acyl esterase
VLEPAEVAEVVLGGDHVGDVLVLAHPEVRTICSASGDHDRGSAHATPPGAHDRRLNRDRVEASLPPMTDPLSRAPRLRPGELARFRRQ